MTRLEQLRVDALLTRDEVSDRTGVPVRTLAKLETDPPKRPRIETLKPLAMFFDVPASSLLRPALPEDVKA